MKNYTTPRTLADSSINPSYDPIERLTQETHKRDGIVLFACFVALAIAAAVIIIGG